MRIGGRRGEDGLTVVEVLVAVVLMAAGVGAASGLMVMATGQGSLSKRGTDAAALAGQEIERARDLSFAAMTAGNIVTTYTVGSDVYTVTRTTTISDPAPNVNRIHVAVTWGGGGVKRYDTETLLTGHQ